MSSGGRTQTCMANDLLGRSRVQRRTHGKRPCIGLQDNVKAQELPFHNADALPSSMLYDAVSSRLLE